MSKIFKKGFTLTEVLLSLGVIGVIAAIALPKVFGDIQKAHLGADLGRAVEILSTGCRNVIEEANENSNDDNDGIYVTLSSIPANIFDEDDTAFMDTRLFNVAKDYFNIEEATRGIDINLSAYNSVINPFTSTWKDYKRGVHYAVLNLNKDDIKYVVHIDVNGSDRPNKFGRDIFMVGLTNTCQVIPAGSQRFSSQVVGSTIASHLTGNCGNGQGLNCTEKVFSNNFKINY